jgi:NitT/TauT family transport system substrate-binding protein
MIPSITRRALVALGPALAGLARPALAQGPEPLSLIFALGVGGSQAPILLAQEKGWYREAGVDLDVRIGRGSAYAVQMAGAGQVDVGEGSLTTMATAVRKGVAVSSIFAAQRRSDMAMLVERDSPITGPADVKGKRLLCFATSPWVPYIDAYLRRGGLTRRDVTVVMADPGAIFTTWSAGGVDAFLTVPSYAQPLVDKTRPTKALHTSDVGLPTLGTGYVVTRETAATKREVMKRFIAVTQRAILYMDSGHEDEAAAAALAQKPNERINPELLKRQIINRRPYSDSDATMRQPIGWQAESDWKAAMTAMEEVKLLEPGSAPQDFYTNDYISDVRRPT